MCAFAASKLDFIRGSFWLPKLLTKKLVTEIVVIFLVVRFWRRFVTGVVVVTEKLIVGRRHFVTEPY